RRRAHRPGPQHLQGLAGGEPRGRPRGGGEDLRGAGDRARHHAAAGGGRPAGGGEREGGVGERREWKPPAPTRCSTPRIASSTRSTSPTAISPAATAPRSRSGATWRRVASIRPPPTTRSPSCPP